MKKLILLATALVFVLSTTHAAEMEYERRAFEGRYGLWADVRCMADSIRVSTESDDSLLARYPALQMGTDAKAALARLGFPRFCEPSATPPPATMISVEMHVRTVTNEDGSSVYFVQLRAAMPDGDFARTSYGQFTRWESSGTLGHTDAAGFRDSIRAAMSEQIEGFATFMGKTRLMAKNR